MADLAGIMKWPESTSGKWALYTIFGFFAFMIVFYTMISAGQRGGETFFANPYLAVTIMMAGLCGIASAFLSFWALVFAHDRKLVLAMSLLVGGFVLYFTVGELIGHP